MIRINLLPLRHSRRQEQVRNEIVVAGGGLVVMCVGMCVAYLFVHAQLSTARAENANLQRQINKTKEMVALVDEQEQMQEDLRTKLAVIKRLKANRVGPVHMLDELSQATPEKLQLTEVEEKQGKVSVVGVAVTNEIISEFLRNLEESEYFKEVYLNAIEQTEAGGAKLKEFSITARLVVPGLDEPQEEEVKSGKSGKRGKRGKR
jgi:type IV pilus assembly protein PilN